MTQFLHLDHLRYEVHILGPVLFFIPLALVAVFWLSPAASHEDQDQNVCSFRDTEGLYGISCVGALQPGPEIRLFGPLRAAVVPGSGQSGLGVLGSVS